MGDALPPLLENLVLTIDPTTGAGQITNYTVAPLALVGYSIESSAGGLLPANGNWNSLQDQSLPGWQEASPTPFVLSELASGEALVLEPFASIELGQLFNPSMPPSGIFLEYVVATSSGTEIGQVVFETIGGQGQVSSLILGDEDPASANVTLQEERSTNAAPTSFVALIANSKPQEPSSAVDVGRLGPVSLAQPSNSTLALILAARHRPRNTDRAIDSAFEELTIDDLALGRIGESTDLGEPATAAADAIRTSLRNGIKVCVDRH